MVRGKVVVENEIKESPIQLREELLQQMFELISDDRIPQSIKDRLQEGVRVIQKVLTSEK